MQHGTATSFTRPHALIEFFPPRLSHTRRADRAEPNRPTDLQLAIESPTLARGMEDFNLTFTRPQIAETARHPLVRNQLDRRLLELVTTLGGRATREDPYSRFPSRTNGGRIIGK
jgi:hypothetical protein